MGAALLQVANLSCVVRSHLCRAAPGRGGPPVSAAQSAARVRSRACAHALSESPGGCCPAPGTDSSDSSDWSPGLAPFRGPSPASPGSYPPAPSRRPQGWPADAAAGGTTARPLCRGDLSLRAFRGPCWSRGRVDPAGGAEECWRGPVSSCLEGRRARCCATGPGRLTGTPAADTGGEPWSGKHSATCW